jgi:hypothetical protein
MRNLDDIKNYRSRPISGRDLRDAILCAVDLSSTTPTRAEICSLLGRKKCPHIVNEIRDMVRDGLLIEETKPYRGTIAYVYTIRGSEE